MLPMCAFPLENHPQSLCLSGVAFSALHISACHQPSLTHLHINILYCQFRACAFRNYSGVQKNAHTHTHGEINLSISSAPVACVWHVHNFPIWRKNGFVRVCGRREENDDGGGVALRVSGRVAMHETLCFRRAHLYCVVRRGALSRYCVVRKVLCLASAAQVDWGALLALVTHTTHARITLSYISGNTCLFKFIAREAWGGAATKISEVCSLCMR